MFLLTHLLRSIREYAYNTARWGVHEFLPVSVRSSLSSRLTGLCSLLGLGTIVLIVTFETRGSVAVRSPILWVQWLLGGLVAILIGNLVKECAVWLSARIVNALGSDFYRKGVMLNGSAFSEVFRSDGTWRRFEFGPRETICEWTDSFGACYRSVTGPRSADDAPSS